MNSFNICTHFQPLMLLFLRLGFLWWSTWMGTAKMTEKPSKGHNSSPCYSQVFWSHLMALDERDIRILVVLTYAFPPQIWSKHHLFDTYLSKSKWKLQQRLGLVLWRFHDGFCQVSGICMENSVFINHCNSGWVITESFIFHYVGINTSWKTQALTYRD